MRRSLGEKKKAYVHPPLLGKKSVATKGEGNTEPLTMLNKEFKARKQPVTSPLAGAYQVQVSSTRPSAIPTQFPSKRHSIAVALPRTTHNASTAKSESQAVFDVQITTMIPTQLQLRGWKRLG